jgi:hypothetical protein
MASEWRQPSVSEGNRFGTASASNGLLAGIRAPVTEHEYGLPFFVQSDYNSLLGPMGNRVTRLSDQCAPR